MISKYFSLKKNTKNLLLVIIVFCLTILYYSIFDITYQSAIDKVLNIELENAKIQSNIVRNILDERLKHEKNSEIVKNEFQRSIENMSTENMFVCMFDSNAKKFVIRILTK